MKILSTPHAHTTFVDGRSTAQQMAQAAYERGFVSLGFSEHATQPVDTQYAMPYAREAEYIQTVRELARLYEGRMKIWLGAERDRVSDCDPARYDYIIGASHYVFERDGDQGDPAAVDGSPERIDTLIANRFHGDSLAFCRDYYEKFAAYIVRIQPQIIAHFDLLSKHNASGRFFREDDPAYRAMALRALSACRQTGALLEMNTGAIARAGHTLPYPAAFLLSAWHEMGGEVIVSSDCHLASQIDAAFDRSAAWLRAAGFRTARRLGVHEALFDTFELDEVIA